MKRRLVDVLRGLVIALLALVAGIPLMVAAALSILFVGLGFGVFLVPPVIRRVRALAGLQRRLAGQWCGVPIATPYRPAPAFDPGVVGTIQRCRWLFTDPATRRDLLWLLVNIPVGAALGLLPFGLIRYGLEGVLVIPVLWRYVDEKSYGYAITWFFDGPTAGLTVLAVVQGVLLILLGLAIGGPLLRRQALVSRRLLAPTRNEELAARVRRLTETRTDVVDAQAAELRRIERDLHDGVQARLVALGMSLGMAEDLAATRPELVAGLLAEAREASGHALAELRHVVRGIHPPVLAERGLDGAVRALALALPLPVEVEVDLPGRPAAPVESAVYFAVAETLGNIIKHSRARRVWIGLHHTEGRLVVTVRDDGTGGADAAGGTGLAGIMRRLAALDGTLTVASPPGGPTVVTMELPCALSSPKTLPSSGTG